MPRRKTRTVTPSLNRIIERIRGAIQEGYPWILYSRDNVYRRTGLTIEENILLSYTTGIVAGAGIYLAGEPHPTKETVAVARAELQGDIREAEKKYRDIPVKRWSYDHFAYRNQESPKRKML